MNVPPYNNAIFNAAFHGKWGVKRSVFTLTAEPVPFGEIAAEHPR